MWIYILKKTIQVRNLWGTIKFVLQFQIYLFLNWLLKLYRVLEEKDFINEDSDILREILELAPALFSSSVPFLWEFFKWIISGKRIMASFHCSSTMVPLAQFFSTSCIIFIDFYFTFPNWKIASYSSDNSIITPIASGTIWDLIYREASKMIEYTVCPLF